jgi:hypothetical protein
MRANTRDCLAALKRGRHYRAGSGAIHTDGRVIMSYGVVIATPDPNDSTGLVRLVTCEKYSQTTTDGGSTKGHPWVEGEEIHSFDSVGLNVYLRVLQAQGAIVERQG